MEVQTAAVEHICAYQDFEAVQVSMELVRQGRTGFIGETGFIMIDMSVDIQHTQSDNKVGLLSRDTNPHDELLAGPFETLTTQFGRPSEALKS